VTKHSDIVALMALEHQTQMLNLMTRVGWEARIAMYENDAINRSLGEPVGMRESTERRINIAVEELLEYMLYSGEAKLAGQVKGTSGYAEEFQKQGPRDSKGRSLRELDLKTRMFRYPLSYLIYSEPFDAMPSVVQSRLRLRLSEVLSGKDTGAKFAHLTIADKTAIVGILRDTKRSLLAD
jgi:hypothetical protein